MTDILASDYAAIVGQLRQAEQRLQEAEGTLQAIQQGDVDAVVVIDKTGKPRVYTLESADHPYQALIEQIQEGAVILGTSGTIIYCNSYLATMLDVPQERVFGNRLDQFVAASCANELSHMLDHALTAPMRSELDLVAADGRQIPIYLSLSPLYRDGDKLLLCGVITDLTEQKTHLRDIAAAAEAARVLAAERDRQAVRLSESEAKFRMLAENANDLIIWVGPDGSRRYVSPAATRIIGVAPATLIDKGLRSFTHVDNRPAMSALHNTLVSGAVTQGSMTFRALNPDRGDVWVEMSARSLVDPISRQPLGYVSVLRDVSDRFRLEAERDDRERELRVKNGELDQLARNLVKARNTAEQANRAKTRFLAAMSHELRTPLNGILGSAQLLRMEGGLTEPQSQRVQSMLTAGTHLLEMISCVLDLSEIETVSVELQTTAINLQNLAEACLNILMPVATGKQLVLKLNIMPDVPRRILADPARLRQILLNLLGNAVKFTPHGMVELRLQTLKGGTRLRFEVADTGPGIPAEQRARLFGAFDRLDADVNETVEGSGLGLMLAKQLAKLMRGRVGYDNNPGGGSVFWLELPLVTEAGETQAPARAIEFNEPSAVQPAVVTQRKRVLVVDDVAMNRDIAAAFIKSAGYDAMCAEGGVQAVETARNHDFAVILMDVRMPEVDGLEATRRIRAIEGPRGRVGIVALTAQVFTEQVRACREAGMDTHVAKPFTLETLLGAVNRAIEAAGSRDVADQDANRSTPAIDAMTAEIACSLQAEGQTATEPGQPGGVERFAFNRTAASPAHAGRHSQE